MEGAVLSVDSASAPKQMSHFEVLREKNSSTGLLHVGHRDVGPGKLFFPGKRGSSNCFSEPFRLHLLFALFFVLATATTSRELSDLTSCSVGNETRGLSGFPTGWAKPEGKEAASGSTQASFFTGCGITLPKGSLADWVWLYARLVLHKRWHDFAGVHLGWCSRRLLFLLSVILRTEISFYGIVQNLQEIIRKLDPQ